MTNKVKYTPQSHPVIAVDFDGTLVKDQFPDLGTPFTEGINTVNDMIEAGYEICDLDSKTRFRPCYSTP